MPRTKRTKAQEDDRGAFLPTLEQIRIGCEEARNSREAKGPRRKKDELGGIREYSAADLGLSEPFDLEHD